MNAMPTLYRGTRYRSRFEARVAQLLDWLGMSAVYEQVSFLLPGGECFLPDFKLIGSDTYLEVRGYSTKKGNQQLEEFPLVLPPSSRFIVLREDKAGGCRCWEEGHWGKLCLVLDRPGYTVPIRVIKGEVQFKLHGHWLETRDFARALKQEGGSIAGAEFRGT